MNGHYSLIIAESTNKVHWYLKNVRSLNPFFGWISRYLIKGMQERPEKT